MNSKPKTQFFSKDEILPFFLAAVMGLQHAFAMVGGLITPPYVIMKFSVDSFPFKQVDLQQYAISAALITSGICTIINVLKLPIPFTPSIFGKQLYLGSGLLAVMGISFTFLPIFDISITTLKAAGVSGEDAYGKLIGTGLVCSLFQVFMSLVPPQILKKLFPPLITGITVMLVGISLTATGMKYWGGGVVCADMNWKQHAQVVNIKNLSPVPSPLCAVGNVQYLGYGSPEFIGLGASVLIFLVFIEIFGSPFLKNSNVIIALLFGYFVAGVSRRDGNRYVISDPIDQAPGITFLWVRTFKIGFYPPAVFPMLISYMVSSLETMGDIGATTEASGLSIDAPEFPESVQGGMLNDAVSSVLSALFTSMPTTTFAQNNGVISITKCASRSAGIACGIWLILFGVLGKIAGVITSIPDCVLGGMTIFLFCSVFISGLKIFHKVDLNSRRNRFISTMSMAVGIGVTCVPFVFADYRASPYTMNFWPCKECTDTEKGLRDGVSIFLSTGFCVGPVLAMFLSAILPEDAEVFSATDKSPDAYDTSGKEEMVSAGEVSPQNMIETPKTLTA